MKSKADFVERQWRASRWFLRLFPFWIALIAGINIWTDLSAGKRFNWDNVVYPLGMIGFVGILYLWMRLIFKFVLRYAKHTDEKHPK